MKRSVLLVLVLLAPTLLALHSAAAPVPPPEGGAGGDGKAVFLAQKCNMCHGVSTAGIEATVKSEKMKGPDLAKVGARHDAEWLGKWLRREVDLDGKKHSKAYTGTPEDLATLVSWMAAQK